MSPKELSFLEQQQHQHGSMSSSSSSSSVGSSGGGVATTTTNNNNNSANNNNSQQQYCLKWNNHQSNLLRAFDRLLQSEAFTDVTLAAEGRSLRAHKVVLSACSSYFETLFEEHPDKAPIIILKDMKFTHVFQLVNFMYRGEINITQDMLAGLLKTAETLKVKGLAEVSGNGGAPGATPTEPPPPPPPPPPVFSQASHQPHTNAAMQAAAAAASMAAFRIQTSNSSNSIAASHPNSVTAASVLTAALSGAASQPSSQSPPSLAPLAALLAPQTLDDERRSNLLKRINSSSNLLGSDSDIKPLEPLNKIARRDTDLGSSTTVVNSLLTNSTSNSPPPHHRTPQQHFLHASPPHRHQSPSLLHSSHFLSMGSSSRSSSSSSNAGGERHTPSKNSNSPLQGGGLTPLPQELTVNAQQDLPSFLQGYLVFKLNDYLGFRTRQQFWEEPAVRRIMEGIKNKEIDMKTAAELLGVSYGTLYGRYREVFGYLKHSWVNKGGRSSTGNTKEARNIWDESRAQEIIMSVLNKELSLTAAAVRLGVDTNTFFAHLTDNGKNKQRVALLMAGIGGAVQAGPLSAASLGSDSTAAAALLAEHTANLLAASEAHNNSMDIRPLSLMTPDHLRGEEESRESHDNREEEDEIEPEVGIEAQDLTIDDDTQRGMEVDTSEHIDEEDEDVEIEEKPVLDEQDTLMAQYESSAAQHLNNGGVKEENELANGEEGIDAEEEEELEVSVEDQPEEEGATEVPTATEQQPPLAQSVTAEAETAVN